MVAILSVLRPELLRLGWLRLMLTLTPLNTVSPKELEAKIAGFLNQVDTWNQRTGMMLPPSGKVPKSMIYSLIHGLHYYHLSEEESLHLTDLGQVLRFVNQSTGFGTDSNPFEWSQETRFIGLRILMGASGDVLIPFIQRWSDSEASIDASQALSILHSVLTSLSAQFPTMIRFQARRQVGRTSPSA